MYDQVTISGAPEFARLTSAFWKSLQMIYPHEYALDKAFCCCGFVESDVFSNRLQILQRGFSPDYSSHFFIRCLASL